MSPLGGVDLGTWKRMKASKRGGIQMDPSELNRGMERLVKRAMPKAIIMAMGQAGLQLMNDAIEQSPQIPFDESTLQGSGSVFVGKALVGTSQSTSRGGRPTPARSHGEKLSRRAFTVYVGFNTPYAARLHEHPEYHFDVTHHPAAGGKFLEYKIFRNAKSYYSLIAKVIKASLARDRGAR